MFSVWKAKDGTTRNLNNITYNVIITPFVACTQRRIPACHFAQPAVIANNGIPTTQSDPVLTDTNHYSC